MKKCYCLILWMLSLLPAGISQVVIQMQVPPLGLTIKPQLWNLALMNGNKEPLSVRVELIMTDVTNNQRVLSGTSRNIILQPGAKQVQLKDLGPIIYNAAGAAYSIDPNPDGFLPVGIFNICYTLIGGPKGPEEGALAEACETFEIEPLSPPMLVIPANNEESENNRPLFSWMPPSPYQSFSNIRYDFTLVEVFPAQSVADAVQQNIPVAAQHNINTTSYQYPMSFPVLDSSKTYAWRVVARNSLAPVSTSETWSFKIRMLQADTSMPVSRGYYAKMRRENDASYVISGEQLRFSYDHETSDSVVDISITDITAAARSILNLQEPNLKVRYGQNYLTIDLQRTGVADKHIYLLELVNAKKEKWYLKFEYRKPLLQNN